jgi:hypothetical protein
MGAPKTVQRRITTHSAPKRVDEVSRQQNSPTALPKQKLSGRAGNRTRDLSHPKRQSCH